MQLRMSSKNFVYSLNSLLWVIPSSQYKSSLDGLPFTLLLTSLALPIEAANAKKLHCHPYNHLTFYSHTNHPQSHSQFNHWGFYNLDYFPKHASNILFFFLRVFPRLRILTRFTIGLFTIRDLFTQIKTRVFYVNKFDIKFIKGFKLISSNF